MAETKRIKTALVSVFHKDGMEALECLQRAFEVAINYSVYNRSASSNILKLRYDTELLITGKKKEKSLAEKYIEAKYLDEILIEQEQEIDSLQRDKQDIKAYLKAILKSAENKLDEKNYICNL